MTTLECSKALAVTAFLFSFCLGSLRAADIPSTLTVQGKIEIDGSPFDGLGWFKFALLHANGSPVYWSNSGMDVGTEEPSAAVSVQVTGGLYSIALGDTALDSMAAIESSDLDNEEVSLRIWFSPDGEVFHRLDPDQRINAVAYAMIAGSVPEDSLTGGHLVDESVTGDKLHPDLRVPGDVRVNGSVRLNVLTVNSADANTAQVSRNLTVGNRSRSVTSLNVEVSVPPGTAPANHVAFFNNLNRAPGANGIAIMLGNGFEPPLWQVDRSNNFITFYSPDERIVGRVEGFSQFDFDRALATISVELFLRAQLGLGLYELDLNLTPTENWLNPGTLPQFDFTRGALPSVAPTGGVLPTATFKPGEFPDLSIRGFAAPSLFFDKGENPELIFSEGELPSTSFSRGSLPSLDIDFRTLSFDFDAGARPSLTVDPGELPTVALDPGRLPTLTFNPGNPPSISGKNGALPSLSFQPGQFPRLKFEDGALPTLTVTPGQLPTVEKLPFTIDPEFTLNEETLAEFIAQFDGDLGRLKEAWNIFSDPVCAEITRMMLSLEGAGVTYESGSADYAEWLKKSDTEEDFLVGDIVGVHGGRISKETGNADQVLVISFKPIVLGNMPPAQEREHYEMVAFLGQVPVKVKGVVKRGDYILASGDGDGLGRAVSAHALTPEDYVDCVGVAWDDSSYKGVKIVNVAIGLRTPLFSNALREQNSRIQSLEGEVATLRESLTQTQAQLAAMSEQFSRLASALSQRPAAPPDSAILSGLSR